MNYKHHSPTTIQPGCTLKYNMSDDDLGHYYCLNNPNTNMTILKDLTQRLTGFTQVSKYGIGIYWDSYKSVNMALGFTEIYAS